MTALDAILISLIVLMALAMFIGSLVLIRHLIAYGRFQLESGQNAFRLNELIEARVAARVQVVKVDTKTGQVLVDRRQPGKPIGEQPPDPNVRQTSILDEVHEAERDADRIMNPDIPWSARDERIEP